MATGGFFDELSKQNAQSLMDSTPPGPEVIDFFHAKASTDGPDDLHHRLGFGKADAARGDHNHDGSNSKPLFDSGSVPGDTNGSYSMSQMSNTMNQVLALLRGKSGLA